MKCEKCKACVLEDYEYGVYGCYIDVPEEEMTYFPDGESGCKLHWKTIHRIIREKDSCYEISLAEGQRLCNPEKYNIVLERANGDKYIELAKHCIGLDNKQPYNRNGKLYFRPYRNYFNTNYDDEIWSDLKFLGYAECDCEYWDEEKKKSVFYWLNEDGRKWLAEKLGIFKIWKERD